MSFSEASSRSLLEQLGGGSLFDEPVEPPTPPSASVAPVATAAEPVKSAESGDDDLGDVMADVAGIFAAIPEVESADKAKREAAARQLAADVATGSGAAADATGGGAPESAGAGPAGVGNGGSWRRPAGGGLFGDDDDDGGDGSSGRRRSGTGDAGAALFGTGPSVPQLQTEIGRLKGALRESRRELERTRDELRQSRESEAALKQRLREQEQLTATLLDTATGTTSPRARGGSRSGSFSDGATSPRSRRGSRASTPLRGATDAAGRVKPAEAAPVDLDAHPLQSHPLAGTTASAPMEAAPAPSSHRERLRAFYARYNPDKVKEVDDILQRYAGRERDLFNALEQKYGSHPLSGRSPPRETSGLFLGAARGDDDGDGLFGRPPSAASDRDSPEENEPTMAELFAEAEPSSSTARAGDDMAWMGDGSSTLFGTSSGAGVGARAIEGQAPRRATDFTGLFGRTTSTGSAAGAAGDEGQKKRAALFAALDRPERPHGDGAVVDEVAALRAWNRVMRTKHGERINSHIAAFLTRVEEGRGDDDGDGSSATSGEDDAAHEVPLPERVKDMVAACCNYLLEHCPEFKDATEEQLAYAREKLETTIMTGLGKKAYEYTADAAADAALRQRLASLQWLTLDDLQVPESVRNETVLALAQNELKRVARSPTPSAKIDNITKSSSIIFSALNMSRSEGSRPGADEFLPCWIATVLYAQPQHLHSDMLYIEAYRDEYSLMSAAGYMLVNLRSAVSFLENLTAEEVGMSEEEFERRMKEHASS